MTPDTRADLGYGGPAPARRETAREALAHLLRTRLGIDFDPADVSHGRAGYMALVGEDRHFVLEAPPHPMFPPDLMLLSFRCSVCRSWHYAKLDRRQRRRGGQDRRRTRAHPPAACGDEGVTGRGTASELRRNAAARLAEIAGYDERFSIEATLERRSSVQVLIRKALRASIGDELLTGEIRELAAIVGGKAWVLDDAIHDETGLPEPTPTEALSVAEFEEIVERELT